MGKSILTKVGQDYAITESEDGSRIGYLSLGKGPGVIVIPGALSTASDYLEFATFLAKSYTVHIIERRGRGESDPQGADYSMEKEVQDVLALQRTTGAVFLIGHSYGGLIALEVARQTGTFRKISVYEPGVSVGGSIPMGWMISYEAALKRKKFLDAFAIFSQGTGPERARKSPRWFMKLILPIAIKSQDLQKMLGLLQQNLLEHRQVQRMDSTNQKYRSITADVLLMYGGKSNIAWVETSMRYLSSVLSHSTVRRFLTLDHFGIDKKNPQMVAQAVEEFLEE